MGLSPGYKQTEAGVIPSEWRIATLGRLIASLDAGVSVNSVGENGDACAHEESILKTSCVFGGRFFPQESKIIRPDDIARAKLSPRKDSIIISRMNTPALVGECGYVPDDFPRLFLPDRLWMTRLSKHTPSCARWLAYLLSSNEFNSAIKGSATGTSGSMKNLSKSALLAVHVPYPERPEQQAIAEALSDADALIESLEQLIAKKRDIKQGVMQELLTGKRRLQGFKGNAGTKQTDLGMVPSDWDLSSIGDAVGRLEAGVSVNSVSEDKDVWGHDQWVLKTSCVSGGAFRPLERKKIRPDDVKRARLSPRRDSIVVSRMNTPDLVGECGYVDQDCPNLFLPDRLWMTRPGTRPTSFRWLAYALSSGEVSLSIKGLATGTSGSMKNIAKPAFLNALIPFPTFEEQTAIAGVLSDMDDELEALETKLRKARQIKQGMMHELLTGRIRLV